MEASLSRRQLIGYAAIALPALAMGAPALAAENDTPQDDATPLDLDASVAIGELTVGYPSAWAAEVAQDGLSCTLSVRDKVAVQILASDVELDLSNEVASGYAVYSLYESALEAMEGNPMRGVIARTDHDGVVDAAASLRYESGDQVLVGALDAALTQARAFTFTAICDEADADRASLIATFEQMWSTKQLAIAADSAGGAQDPAAADAQEPAQTSEPTMAHSNALAKAQDYLAFMSFSRSGLIEQLEYEGFSTEDATWATDNCGADWNEQAALKAQSYLDFMSFSRDGLIEQLEYEGFTPDEAEYGVTAVGY